MTYVFIAIGILTTGIMIKVGNHYYWKGRLAGWLACENMARQRAEECGYDKTKFFSDILQ
jgi:hypothetical protein